MQLETQQPTRQAEHDLVFQVRAAQADPAQKNLVMGFYNATKSLGSILGSLMAGFAYTVHAKLPFVIVVAAYAMGIVAAAGFFVYGKKKQLTKV